MTTYWRIVAQSGDFDGEDPNQVLVRHDIPDWAVNKLTAGEVIEDWITLGVCASSDEQPTTDYLFAVDLIPIVSERFKSILLRHGVRNIDFYPLDVGGVGFDSIRYWVANFRHVIDGIDRNKSLFEVWTKETLLFWEKRPWLLGQFRYVRRAILDPQQVGEASLFRLWGCSIVVVADGLKTVLENEGLTGIGFWPLERDALGTG